MHKAIQRSLGLLLLACGLQASAATAFPNGPVRYMVPAPPGGLIDIMARMVAQGAGDRLKQSVVVENRPGGNTVIGADAVARSAPDGQTWLAVSITLAANATLMPNMSLDVRKDLVPVARLAVTPMGVVVPANSPYRSLDEIVKAAKGGKMLNYGSSGYGTPTHLATAMMEGVAGIKLNHIPYKGGAPALNDLIGGQLDFIIATLSEAKPFLDSGRLKLLSVTSPERVQAFPDAPTTAEGGYPGLLMEGWTGVMVPAGTPAPVIDRIAEVVLDTAKEPAFVRRAEEMGFVMAPQGPADFKRQFVSEVDRLRDLIQTRGIKME